MLFQRPMLFPWLTTRDNVLFGPRAQRSRGLDDRTDAEMRAAADALLDTVGLTEFADAYPHELSGGMQHRAAFARAVITQPSVLLMDEPFGALDAITRLRMQQFLLAMWETYRLTILFVTHDVDEAILLGDRIAVMGGRPPRLSDVIGVPLTRPRSADSVDADVVLATKRHIRSVLTH
jgi:ABC-type nitrate/sulfonate/bicarbonate transport system ATPase subunit